MWWYEISISYGIVAVSHVGPKLLNRIPRENKKCDSLNEFKAMLKTWIPQNCS